MDLRILHALPVYVYYVPRMLAQLVKACIFATLQSGEQKKATLKMRVRLSLILLTYFLYTSTRRIA